jgi:hypothetical protein
MPESSTNKQDTRSLPDTLALSLGNVNLCRTATLTLPHGSVNLCRLLSRRTLSRTADSPMEYRSFLINSLSLSLSRSLARSLALCVRKGVHSLVRHLEHSPINCIHNIYYFYCIHNIHYFFTSSICP